MKVVIYGATGMIGQAVLRETLLAADVEQVTVIGRSPTGQQHPKLRELLLPDMFDPRALAGQLGDIDACFYCLGVSSNGMSEADYQRTTYELALVAAHALLEQSPGATFVFVSGAGADSSEQGRVMWARVKGKAENALLALPFRAVHVFRPALVQPVHGVRSRTRAYRVLYALMRPVLPLLRLVAPKLMTTSERVGLAMLAVARDGHALRVLENHDIDAVGRAAA